MGYFFKKGILITLFFLFVLLPGSFYITYVYTDSIWLSFLVVVGVYFLWRYTFGGGLRKRRRYVDVLLSQGFPVSEEDPLLDPDGFIRKDWLKGVGYTDDQNQPMFVKVDECGVAMLYVCRASGSPFVVPWERISQIKLVKGDDNKEKLLARIFVPGVGMKLFIPWEDQCDQHVPDNILYEKETVQNSVSS